MGGLAILREIQALLPHEHLIYIADQAHLPYGPRPLLEVQAYIEYLSRWLLDAGAQVIVIACNTASAAALYYLRETFPHIPFVGMEPAIRPAAQHTCSGVVGVIATAATFQGQLYASLVDRFAEQVQIVRRACPEFVLLAERGAPWTDADAALADEILQEIKASGADQLVLGCTHFAFLKPLLQRVLGEGVTIVDPSPAIARQTERVVQHYAWPSQQHSQIDYFTTGAPDIFQAQIEKLLGIPAPSVAKLDWLADA